MKITTLFSRAIPVAAVAAILLLGGSSQAFAASFARDLTLGSSGGDVTELQNFLIKQGFPISAGATGYFGAQTKAALASYQAAHGIVPAAGYFGSITRGKVTTATGDTTSGNNGGTTSGNSGTTLSGREATIRDFKLVSEESDGNEGARDVQVATVEFDVRDGDVRVERLELTVSATDSTLGTQPWKYFDRIAIKNGSKTVAAVDTDNRDDWNQVTRGTYRLTLTGLNMVVRKGDSAELTIVTDIASSIDTTDQAQSFTFSIADRGIRMTDAAGIQQYTGNGSDTINIGFSPEENGDLLIRSSNEDPDASILVAKDNKESDTYDVFAFEIRNRDEADTEVREVTIDVTDLNSGVSASDVLRRATLELAGKSYKGTVTGNQITFKKVRATVGGDDTEAGTLSVRLARNATSTPIAFSLAAAGIEAEGVDSGDDALISGMVSSEIHTIAFTGISVNSSSVSQSASVTNGNIDSSYATYTIKFTVEGIDDDVYVASTTAASGASAGVTYAVEGDTFVGTQSAALSSSAKMVDGFYRVPEGKSETFTLTVFLNPETAGYYRVRLNDIMFSVTPDAAEATTFTVLNNSKYVTDPVYIPS